MKPKRIILIRHGESAGNADKDVYRHTPDYAVRLTNKGIYQAKDAGQTIKEFTSEKKYGDDEETATYGIYYSPYFRTRETMDNALKTQEEEPINEKYIKFKKEDPRLREQEYSGKLRTTDRIDFEKEREQYGKFFYRMDGGESGADLWDRMSDFIGTLHRDFENKEYPKNILIFTHGMSMRIFIMRFFKFTVEEFEMWKNPRNAEMYILELQADNKYKLITEIQKHKEGYGHKYKQ